MKTIQPQLSMAFVSPEHVIVDSHRFLPQFLPFGMIIVNLSLRISCTGGLWRRATAHFYAAVHALGVPS